MTKTRIYQLVEERLGRDLRSHVADLRGTGASWNAVARDLFEQTQVDVTDETLRRWFPDLLASRRTTDVA